MSNASTQEQPDISHIGRYEIVRQIGHGGMSIVYLAHDPLVKRHVAIKLLSRQRVTDDDALSRFQREAEIVASLQHNCIVPVFDFGHYDHRPYMVMQYMAGGSLADKLTQEPLVLVALAPIMRRVADALDMAHQRHIIHRDLKPANVLFDKLGQSYLADFGVAKIRAGFAQQLTGNLVLGTPEYMSPEQVRGQQSLDGRSDVYGLGVVFFQALTGQYPFRTATPMGTAVAHIMDPIPSVLAIRPNLPPETDLIVNKVLAKDREKRYQTPQAFAEEVQLLADGRGYHLRLNDL